MQSEQQTSLRNAALGIALWVVVLGISWWFVPAAGIGVMLIGLVWTMVLNVRWAVNERQRERFWEGRAAESSQPLPWLSKAATLWLVTLFLVLPLSLVSYGRAFGTAGFVSSATLSSLSWVLLGVEHWWLGLLGLHELFPSLSSLKANVWWSQLLLLSVRLSLLVLVLHFFWRRWSLNRQLRHSMQALALHREYSLSRLQRMGAMAAPELYRTLQKSNDESVRIGCIEVLTQLENDSLPRVLRQILNNARVHTPSLVSSSSRALAQLDGRDRVLEIWKQREEALLQNSRPPFPREQFREALTGRDDFQFLGYNPEAYPVALRAIDQSEVIFVQGGLTRLVSDSGAMGEKASTTFEGPERVIYVSDYLIDKSPVTVEQYLLFLRSEDPDGRAGMDGWRWVQEPCAWSVRYDRKEGWVATDKQYLRCPMVQVSWEGALAYARWIGGSLPTYAQFKRAAAGKYPDYRHFPWGNQPLAPQRANYRHEGSGATTTPVGTHHEGRSPFGVYDMAGNVAEWCMDAYDPRYLYLASTDNPLLFEEDASLRVLLGGSWNEGSAELNNYAVAFASPMTWSLRYGFRCVMSLSELR